MMRFGCASALFCVVLENKFVYAILSNSLEYSSALAIVLLYLTWKYNQNNLKIIKFTMIVMIMCFALLS